MVSVEATAPACATPIIEMASAAEMATDRPTPGRPKQVSTVGTLRLPAARIRFSFFHGPVSV
jgi:hypothetical protein